MLPIVVLAASTLLANLYFQKTVNKRKFKKGGRQQFIMLNTTFRDGKHTKSWHMGSTKRGYLFSKKTRKGENGQGPQIARRKTQTLSFSCSWRTRLSADLIYRYFKETYYLLLKNDQSMSMLNVYDAMTIILGHTKIKILEINWLLKKHSNIAKKLLTSNSKAFSLHWVINFATVCHNKPEKELWMRITKAFTEMCSLESIILNLIQHGYLLHVN